MKIQSVHIRNYRKLKNCHIDFGEKKTVLVGANNSGKTSAISAIVWFLKNTERFTLKEFTVTNWALINTIGEKWLEKDSVDDALLSSHQWDNIVPSMDVWINVEGIYNQLNTRYMKNLFKMYRDWKNRKFVEKINKVYFKQDNAGNLFMEGSLHVYGKNNGIITSWMDKSKEDVKNSLAHRLS